MTGSQDPGNFMNNALFNTNNIIQRAIFLYFNQRHPAESLSMLCMISLLLIIILVIYYRKIERKNRRQTIDSLDHSIHKEQYQDTLTTFKHVESKQPESSYV
jgi:ABC-type Fe3+ transport system permease subunit